MGDVSDEPEQTPQPATAIEVALVYANRVQASGTPWDLSLEFAYEGGDGAAKHGVRVVVAWEQAAALQDLLAKMVTRYERELGAIRPFVAEAVTQAENADDVGGGAP